MNIFKIILIFFVSNLSYSQGREYFAKTFEIGTSLTYIWDDGGYPIGTYRYDEITLNINVKMRLHKRVWIGTQVAPIFTKKIIGGNTKKENYNFYGLYLQYDIYLRKNGRIYFETSINKSNMVHSFISDPYKQKNIYYLGFGGGVNILLNKNNKKNIFLEIGFFNYVILNKIIAKSNYTQYILGLNYRFGKK